MTMKINDMFPHVDCFMKSACSGIYVHMHDNLPLLHTYTVAFVFNKESQDISRCNLRFS